jgi:hypothetical protein
LILPVSVCFGIEDETLREDVGFVHHWSYPCWRRMKPSP